MIRWKRWGKRHTTVNRKFTGHLLLHLWWAGTNRRIRSSRMRWFGVKEVS